MSQAKVDKYKKEKANRKKEMAKQKTEKIIGIICGCAILVAIVGWAGYTGYSYMRIISRHRRIIPILLHCPAT